MDLWSVIGIVSVIIIGFFMLMFDAIIIFCIIAERWQYRNNYSQKNSDNHNIYHYIYRHNTCNKEK